MMRMIWRGPYLPLYSQGVQGYMKPYNDLSLGVLFKYYSSSFRLYQLVLDLYEYIT